MVDLTSEKIMCIYCLKRNNLDKDRAYILCVLGHGLHLISPLVPWHGRIKYFYIIRDILVTGSNFQSTTP